MSNQLLLLSAQRALIFNILCCVRFIFIEIKEDKLLLWVYSDRELSEDEKDIYYAVSGEVCGDFPGLDNSNVEFWIDNSNFENIKYLQHLVYARYENV